MQVRHIPFITAISLFSALASAQDAPPAAQAGSTPIIRTEKRLVLVDAVVTDKKGAYIRDLTAKDFKVWEDNKEQTISSVSLESDATAAAGSLRRYLVLFFDNSTMDTADQMRALAAAQKFIRTRMGPADLISIMRYSGGAVEVLQDFTGERDRLPQELRDQLTWLRQQTDLPLCVGFGVSRPEHVRMLRDVADGVIVGSAVVRRVEQASERPFARLGRTHICPNAASKTGNKMPTHLHARLSSIPKNKPCTNRGG